MRLFSEIDEQHLRRHWELLIVLLALLASFACIFLATGLALRMQPEILASANMLPVSQADYGRLPGEDTSRAPIDPGVIAEAATDKARLASTPATVDATPASVVLLPSSTAPSGLVPTQVGLPGATGVPSTAVSPTPTVADEASPTSPPEPTATQTGVPTNTPVPTATQTRLPTLTATSTRLPSPTATNTATPIPPTPTATNTATPIPPTPTPTETATPIPPTPGPTDTPTPTNTPTRPPPIVTGIIPHTEVNTGTVKVIISGLNFQTTGCGAQLRGAVTDVDLIGSTCLSTTTLEAWVPTDTIAGYYDVAVINGDGQWDALGNAYTATNPIPSISGLSPAVSILAASEVVTVTGEYFRNTGTPGNLRGALDGTSTPVTYIGTDTVTVVVPPSLRQGVYTLTITNPGPTDPTYSLTNSLAVVLTYTTTCQPAPLCQVAIGLPDGDFYQIMGTETITIDFGSAFGEGIRKGLGYDMVFYEWPNPALPDPGIGLDYVTIELSEDGTTWYPVFDWDGVLGGVTGTNIDSYAADGESQEEVIPGSVLYPGAPYPYGNSGIAIDIDGLIPVPGPFPWVRVFYPPEQQPGGGSLQAQVDSIVRLH